MLTLKRNIEFKIKSLNLNNLSEKTIIIVIYFFLNTFQCKLKKFKPKKHPNYLLYTIMEVCFTNYNCVIPCHDGYRFFFYTTEIKQLWKNIFYDWVTSYIFKEEINYINHTDHYSKIIPIYFINNIIDYSLTQIEIFIENSKYCKPIIFI